ncbi:MAG: hypothetical protein ACYDEP_12070 [Acidimicrobiales bacterium]
MACVGCGAEIGAAAFCPRCGKAQSPPQSVATGAQPTVPSAIDFRRLGVGDFVAGIATLLIFISLFITWYSAGLYGSNVGISAMGTGAGGWRILILLLCIAIIGFLFIRTFFANGIQLPIPHWQLLAVATTINGILVLMAFLIKPSGTSAVSNPGGWVALVAAVAAIIGAILRRNDPEVIVTSQTPVRSTPAMGGYATGQATTSPAQAPAQEATTSCPTCHTTVWVRQERCHACGSPIMPGA